MAEWNSILHGHGPAGRREVDMLVLGLVRWKRADGGAASLTRNEIAQIGGSIASALDKDMRTDHDLDDTYYRMQIVPARRGKAECNCRAFDKLVPEAFRSQVNAVQVGFYHNRLIVRYEIRNEKPSLHTLRILRDELTRTVVEKVYKPLEKEYAGGRDGLQLITIQHTALQLVPRGTHALRSELGKLRKGGYSRAYSLATTTFGVYISNSRLTPMGRRHYVRLSMSGATVYLAGRRWPDDLLIALIDAIYYGGLYGPVDEMSLVSEAAELPASNAWSDSQLLRVFALLRDSLRASAGNESALRAAQVGAVFAMASTLVGIVGLLVR